MKGAHPGQLGFAGLLEAADHENRARAFARETGHLPGSLAEALPFFEGLLEAHHTAMLEISIEEAMRLRGEAHLLAQRLNGGAPGILAGDDAPGRVLARETAAAPESVPLWGQEGSFVVTVCAVPVRIAMEGVFGIGSGFGYWPGFAAHAVDHERPFISETGFRSFLGISLPAVPGELPDAFVARVIETYVARELHGRLPEIAARCRPAT
jgi:hypothetical protein